MVLLALNCHPPPTTAGPNAAPTSILLGRPWPHASKVSSTTTIFIDNLGHQLIHIDNVYIALGPDSGLHRLSPNEFDMGHFMFGTMLDLTTTPSTRSSTTIWRRVPAYVIPNIINRIHDFIALPRDMLRFAIDATIHRPLLVAARQAAGSRCGRRTLPLLLPRLRRQPPLLPGVRPRVRAREHDPSQPDLWSSHCSH